MMIGDYKIVEEEKGYALLKRKDGRRTVVGISRRAGQVYSTMPGDMPRDGGTWFAGITQFGIDYVASWYSRSYANQIYREAVDEAHREADCLEGGSRWK